MRISDYLAIAVIAILAYMYITSSSKVEIRTEYVKGDTVHTVEYVTKVDTVVKYKYKTNIDTVNTTDTLYLTYWTGFKLGNDTLGTSGVVHFDMKDFTFTDVVYNYPKEISLVTDTLKITETKTPPLYKNSWFYSTIASIMAIIAILSQ